MLKHLTSHSCPYCCWLRLEKWGPPRYLASNTKTPHALARNMKIYVLQCFFKPSQHQPHKTPYTQQHTRADCFKSINIRNGTNCCLLKYRPNWDVGPVRAALHTSAAAPSSCVVHTHQLTQSQAYIALYIVGRPPVTRAREYLFTCRQTHRIREDLCRCRTTHLYIHISPQQSGPQAYYSSTHKRL